MSRAELEAELERRGAKIVKTVSKSTDLLIIGENPSPQKIAKALELGIPIIDLKQEPPALLTGDYCDARQTK
jgi:NAD-dependent DNA ligase